jgi:hypothetical protein
MNGHTKNMLYAREREREREISYYNSFITTEVNQQYKNYIVVCDLVLLYGLIR